MMHASKSNSIIEQDSIDGLPILNNDNKVDGTIVVPYMSSGGDRKVEGVLRVSPLL
jgi:hypothetical protein